MSKPRAFVVTGPSGVGKGTLISRLLEQCSNVELSVSATTRPMRQGEKNGINYVFLSTEEFEARANSGEFLEHAEYAGYRYGTPRAEVFDRLERGKSVILEIELDGARQVKRAMPEAVQVFIRPPSLEELKMRLENRGTDSADVISRRLEAATVELKAESEFDKAITNDDRERAAQELIEFVKAKVR